MSIEGHLLEIFVHPTFHSVGLKSKVHISVVPIVHVVLVEHIVQALVEIFQVEEDHCSPSFHANLNLVNVSAHLQKNIIHNFSHFTYHISHITITAKITIPECTPCLWESCYQIR